MIDVIIESILKESLFKNSVEFPTQEALDKYLKDHPDANPRNHSVKTKSKWSSGNPPFKPSKKINLDDAERGLKNLGYTMKHVESTPSGTFFDITDKSGKTERRSATEIKYFLTH